jgi:hypothetical protein
MKVETLSNEERHDILKFVTFMVTIVSIVVIVWIVKGTWADEKWVAVGAVAALAQAVAVSIGVLYAAGQIKALRQEGDRRRRHELLDRLDTVLPELEAAASTASLAWLIAGYVWSRYSVADPEYRLARKETIELFDKQINEYQTALISMRGNVNKVVRCLRSLGYPASDWLLVELDARATVCPLHEQFAWVEERGTFSVHDFEPLHASIKRVMKVAEQMTDQNAPKSS